MRPAAGAHEERLEDRLIWAAAVPSNPTHEMLRLLSGYWYSQVLYVAAELGLADCLAAGPKSVALLADETGCDADSLYRFLRALASAGILREVQPHTFELTPLSDTLRSKHPDSLRPLALLGGHPLHWQAWGRLVQSVRTGETAFDAAHGTSFFDAVREDSTLSSALHASLGRLHEVDRDVVAALTLDRFTRMIDVGGGVGRLAQCLATANPAASVILFDQAHALAEAKRTAAIEYVAGDFMDAVPPGGDAYFLKFVLHDWNDAQAGRILSNCRTAMHPAGRIFVIEVVVPGDDAASIAKTHDINMLVLTGGRERTELEYRALFEAAGLDLIGVSRTRLGVGILEGAIAPPERRGEG